MKYEQWFNIMKNRIKSAFAASVLAIATLSGAATAARAQEWVFGAGFADFSKQGSVDGGILVIEHHNAPFHSATRFSLGWAQSTVVHTTGDLFLGAGLAGVYDLNHNWFVEASMMPGVFLESRPGNNLGSTFEIRSILGVGYHLQNGNSISLALGHKSNASTAASNPGVNTVMLRWRTSF